MQTPETRDQVVNTTEHKEKHSQKCGSFFKKRKMNKIIKKYLVFFPVHFDINAKPRIFFQPLFPLQMTFLTNLKSTLEVLRISDQV